jgi:hypothetical protein
VFPAITDQTRLAIVTVEDSECRIRNFIRRELGSTEWPDSGRLAGRIVILTLRRMDAATAKQDARALSACLDSNTCQVLVDSLVKVQHPTHWRALKETASRQTFSSPPQRFYFGHDRQFLYRQVIRQADLMGVCWVNRLVNVLEHDRGVSSSAAAIEKWKSQFDSLGVSHLWKWIAASLHLIDAGQMYQVLLDSNIHQGNTCLLSNSGSDLHLKRFLERTNPHTIPTLSEILQRGHVGPLTIAVDTIQGGGQLLDALSKHGNQLSSNGQRIRIVPCHATEHGVETVRSEVQKQVNALLDFDLQYSLVTKNQRGESAIPMPELEMRLGMLGCKPQIISEAMEFSKKIGWQLTDQNRHLGKIEPLGRRNLGLTTILAGCPGQGVLPLLWLGSSPSTPVQWAADGILRKVDWRPLFPHFHDQAPKDH